MTEHLSRVLYCTSSEASDTGADAHHRMESGACAAREQVQHLRSTQRRPYLGSRQQMHTHAWRLPQTRQLLIKCFSSRATIHGSLHQGRYTWVMADSRGTRASAKHPALPPPWQLGACTSCTARKRNFRVRTQAAKLGNMKARQGAHSKVLEAKQRRKNMKCEGEWFQRRVKGQRAQKHAV